MPTYHSAHNTLEGLQTACGAGILPLKTKVKGTAPPCPETVKDIVDEAIEYFRANILFRSYEPEGPADLVLCYLTIYFSELLRSFKTIQSVAEARKSLTNIALSQQFLVPGDASFCLAGFFAAPQTRAESEAFRNYFLQLRQEAGARFLETIYTPEGTQNKWWFQFSRRKFMNIEKAS